MVEYQLSTTNITNSQRTDRILVQQKVRCGSHVLSEMHRKYQGGTLELLASSIRAGSAIFRHHEKHHIVIIPVSVEIMSISLTIDFQTVIVALIK